jgi:hypothetical protein
MQYETRRRMTLAGVAHEPGQLVSQDIVRQIDPGRLASLIRVGHFRMRPNSAEAEVAVAFGEVPTDDPVEPAEDMCPQCGKGPFKRLSSHITKAHSE